MTDDLVAILRELRASLVVPPERRLWGLAEIADYSGYSVSTVSQRIVCLPDFPQAIEAVTKAQPRWPAGEVMDFFESRRRKPRTGRCAKPAASMT